MKEAVVRTQNDAALRSNMNTVELEETQVFKKRRTLKAYIIIEL